MIEYNNYTTWQNYQMTSKTILTSLTMAGCLILGVAPLILGIFAAIQGTPYYKSIIKPDNALWSFNPIFNVWPLALLLGVIIAIWYTLEETPGRRRFRYIVQDFGTGLAGGCLISAGALSCLVYLGAWLNARLDSSPPEQHQAQVIEKTINRHKFGASYYLVVPDWRVPEATPVLVYLGEDQQGYELSQKVEVSAPVYISTGGGFLGLDWVIAVEPVGDNDVKNER